MCACRWESCASAAAPFILVGGNKYEWRYSSHYDVALDVLGKVIGFSITLEKTGARINVSSFVKQTQGVESGTTALWMLQSGIVVEFDEMQGFCEVYESKATEEYAFIIWSLDLWKGHELSSSILLGAPIPQIGNDVKRCQA